MKRAALAYDKLDWLTIFLFLALVFAGWINIYSASFNPEETSIFSFSQEYGRQFLWICVSLVVGLLILLIEGEFLRRLSVPVYLAVLLLLVLVLFFGKEVGGNKAWFRIGGFGLQPSEFAKMATSLMLAWFVSSSGSRFRALSVRAKAVMVFAIPAGLILLQPDTGTVLVFVSFIFPLYREGFSGNILIVGIAGIVLGVLSILMSYTNFTLPLLGEVWGSYVLIGILVAIGLLGFILVRWLVLPRFRRRNIAIVITSVVAAVIFSSSVNLAIEKVMQPHQKKRIEVLLGITEDPQGAGYNVKQSKTAIGSGGFSGKGYLEGPFTKFNFVPEQSTDFIFCTVGEEWGFLGSSFVIILYIALILRLFFLAERQRSQFSRVYGYCAGSILFMHLLINVGMVIGLVPVIGIPLPFFSYGGSSIIGFTMLLFMMLRLDSERLEVFR